MAKNISTNQWLKNIADDTYVETAVLNNILLITAKPATTTGLAASVTVGEIRNPELFLLTDNVVKNRIGRGIIIDNNKVMTNTTFNNTSIGVTWALLKTKQLETDFYTPEQLAEMHPDDPVYQVATADLPKDDNPTLTDIDSDLSKVIPINEP